jgi:hypothetical protein
MSRRRSSGLFETIIKSVFGFGTTVHHSTDWRGRRKKVVLHHDTGKSNTTVHGGGFWGNITRNDTPSELGRITDKLRPERA